MCLWVGNACVRNACSYDWPMMIQVNVRLSRLGAEGTKLEVPNNDLAFYKTARRWPRCGVRERPERCLFVFSCAFFFG